MAQRIKIRNKWRIDDDGMLRITADILSAGVYNYAPDEMPGVEAVNGKVPVLISTDIFTKDALKSLEGKPITVPESVVDGAPHPHKWRDPENAAKDGFTVGAIAGDPKVSGDKIRVDMLITDKSTIDKVVAGELCEVSAAYVAEVEEEKGTFDGKLYTGRQGVPRFNHVLLLPSGEGRLGKDARIINKKEERSCMGVEVSVRAKNGSARKYQFSNAADKDEAERMSEDTKEEVKAFNAEELSTAMGKVEELQKQLDDLSREKEDALKVIAEYKERIEKLTSAETQEALAREAKSQIEDEEIILDNAEDVDLDVKKDEDGTEEIKEKVKNELKTCNSFSARRKLVVSRVMNAKGLDIAAWSQDAVDGAFEALAAEARVRASRRVAEGRSVMGGASARVNNAASASNFARMLRPMRVKNSRNKEHQGKGE